VWRTEGVFVIKFGRLRKIDKFEAPTQTVMRLPLKSSYDIF